VGGAKRRAALLVNVVARRDASGNIYYYAEDFIGSSRVITQSNGTLCSDGDFYPFGGERIVTNTCTQNYKFEGKERDTETGNDDFGALYYTSRLGRWLSADWSAVPAPVPYANLSNPQTLNLYAIVSDNPETFADLDGHCGPQMSPVSTALIPCPNRPSLFATEGEGFEENSGINENAGIPQWYLNSQRQKNRPGNEGVSIREK